MTNKENLFVADFAEFLNYGLRCEIYNPSNCKRDGRKQIAPSYIIYIYWHNVCIYKIMKLMKNHNPREREFGLNKRPLLSRRILHFK